MKNLTALVVTLALASGGILATPTLVTRPEVPTAEALARLNLVHGWTAHLPVDGERDGIATMQMFPGQILIQLRSGLVVSLDAETGQTQWRAQVADPYHVSIGLGVNAKTVFGYHTLRVFALDRLTGRLQWQYRLPDVPTAPPVATNNELYVCTGRGHLYAFQLPVLEDELGSQPAGSPKPDKPEKPGDPPTSKPAPAGTYIGERTGARSSLGLGGSIADAEAEAVNGKFRLLTLYEVNTLSRVETQPLLMPSLPDEPGNVVVLGVKGTIEGMAKRAKELAFRVEDDAAAATGPTQHGMTGYFSLQNGNVWAVNLEKGHTDWRFAAPTGAALPLAATDDSVFLTIPRAGLYRVNRETGREDWHAANAEQFLAANKKFVYATDRLGQLVVIDAVRGNILSTLNTRSFTVPLSNEYSDRIYLAAHDGTVTCLHDREHARPWWSRKPASEKKKEEKKLPEEPKPEVKKPEEPKPDAKKPEEKK
jgi:outer membrane protein assembly factor BamB